ncbi:hypothetical protein BGZ98_001955 [Dissophora globulifera]|nr:hypothetical protein BGZ98_001955 [Dissophora globulifera]
MPGMTMGSNAGVAFPPHCFCFKPAAEIYTESDGLVYECHYTNPNLWLKQQPEESTLAPTIPQPTPPQPPPPPQQHQPLGSSPTTISDALQPWPQIFQQHPSPTVSRDPARTAHIKVIVDALNAIVDPSKSVVQSSWGRPSRDHTWDGPATGVSSGNGAASYGIGNATSKGNVPIHGDTSVKGACIPDKVIAAIAKPASRNIHHRIAGRTPFLGGSSTHLLATAPNSQQVLVCGFHLHASDWGNFKSLVRSEDCARDNDFWEENNNLQEGVTLARRHHEVVLKHLDVRRQLVRVAQGSRCAPNVSTIYRWIDCRNEMLAVRKYPLAAGTTSPLGGAPVCYCGVRMKLSSRHHLQSSTIALFCALRLADFKGGCSRVMDAGSWYQWQTLKPIHLLGLVPLAAEAEAVEADASHSPERYGRLNGHLDCVDGALVTLDTDKWTAESDDGTSTYETDTESQGSSGHETGTIRDGSGTWDQDATPEGANVTATRLRSLPLPTGLVMRGTGFQRATARSEEGSSDDDRAQQPEDDSMNPRYYDLASAVSTQPSLEPVRLFPEYTAAVTDYSLAALADQLTHLHEALIPDGMGIEAKLQVLEARVNRWRESCGRLRDYSEGMQEDGYGNPTLKCRRCKEGLLLHANVPCYHLVMCDECIDEDPQCVICHAAIESTQRTFWG